MPRPPERRFFVLFMGFWLPVLLYVTAIFTISSQPHLGPPMSFPDADKVLHIGEYVVLGILLVRALRATLRASRPLFAAMIAISAVALVGAGDESFQRLIPGRTCDLYDFFADVLGGSLAQVFYVLLARG